ncbi:MAG: hypothetical protein R2755_12375 [Acidimicrobiales bacterium]
MTAPAGAARLRRDRRGRRLGAGRHRRPGRRLAGKIQGRRTTAAAEPPLDVPPGTWGRTLRTSWVDPGYVETDAVWCAPDGEPVGPLGNGGAFGSKRTSPLPAVARELAGPEPAGAGAVVP